jgi:pimeloyl-ACP methyl ester carboxylesterase
MDAHLHTALIGSERIRFYERGVGIPLVLIHGMFGDHLDWESVLEPLSESNRVIAFDLPGFGESSKPRRDYSEELFTQTLEELLFQLGIDNAILAGNSFGAEVAIFYALRRPQSVSKLVLVDSGGFREIAEEERRFVEERFSESAIASLTPEINAAMFAPVFNSPSKTSTRYLERQNEKLRRPDYPAYAYALSRSIRLVMNTYLLDRLQDIQCPTLIVWGEQDRVLPAAQGHLALSRLREGQIKVIPGCGHAPQIECPQAFLDAVQPFLRETTEGTPPNKTST